LIVVRASLDVERLIVQLKGYGFDIRLAPSGLFCWRMLADLQRRLGKFPRSPPEGVERLLWDNADRVGKWLERDGSPVVEESVRPLGCSPTKWAVAQRGLARFAAEGWGEKATRAGRRPDELYRAPDLWSQIHRTGAVLLIGDGKIVEVTEGAIKVETEAGSRFKFRRAGQEHIA
jgi:hypothetical protein